MLDNLTEKFGFFQKKNDPVRLINDWHIPRRDENGQWWYGYEKVYMRRHKPCTFPLYNGKMDPCSKDT